MMRLDVVNTTIEELEKIIPEDKLILLRLNVPFLSDIKLLKASEDSEVMGFIVTSTNSAFPSKHDINYISVLNQYKNNNHSTTLLNNCVRLYPPDKYTRFCVLLDGTNVKYKNIFKKSKYKNTAQNILLHYSVEAFRNAEFIDNYDELTAITPYIMNLKEVKRINIDLNTFAKELSSNRFATDFNNLDEEYTQFFVIKKTIIGYVAAQRFKDKYLIIQDQYCKKIKEAEIAIPALLTSIFHLVAQKQNDDFRILALIEDLLHASAMKSVFGQWEEAEIYQQWIL